MDRQHTLLLGTAVCALGLASAPPTTGASFIQNGDFEGNCTPDGTGDLVPNGWTKSGGDPPVAPTLTCAADNGPSAPGVQAVRWVRPTGSSSGRHIVIRQTIDVDAAQYAALHLTLDVLVTSHNLVAGGTISPAIEWPVFVQVSYKRATDPNVSQTWRHGYYLHPPGDGSRIDDPGTGIIPVYEDTQVAPGVWETHTFDLLQELPDLGVITQIVVGGAGWAYDGRVDNVQLVGTVASGAVGGFRMLDQSDPVHPGVGIALQGALDAGQTLVERLPADVTVAQAWAMTMAPPDCQPDSADCTPVPQQLAVTLESPTIEEGRLVQPMQAPGAVAVAYTISRPLLPGELLDGEIASDTGPGVPIDNLFNGPGDGLFEQLNALYNRISNQINSILCTAFSAFPGPYHEELVADCFKNTPPATISFWDDTLTNSNHGESKLSVGVGKVGVEPCCNLAELFYIGNTIVPAIQGEMTVGARFHIVPLDVRNQGKKAAATVTMTGGNTVQHAHGYEGHIEAWALNPFPPPPAGPPAVPAMAVVSDRIEAEFLSGLGGVFAQYGSPDLLATNFEFEMVASPLDCGSSDSEPQSDYTVVYETTLHHGPEYLLRIHDCSANITAGIASGTYKFSGTVPSNLLSCGGQEPAETVDGNCPADTTMGKGVRFESIDVDFHHIDLRIASVDIETLKPLDGVVDNIIVTICNDGDPGTDAETVRFTVTDSVSGLSWIWPLDAPKGGEPCFQRILGWDTTGLFGTGVHDLCVEVESPTVAELDYGDNDGCIVGVEVQPSVKAAFISCGATPWPGQCGDCGEVQVWNTRTRCPIGKIDITQDTGYQSPEPRATGLSIHGDLAWTVLTRANGFDYAVLGIDVDSCWSGTCQKVAQPTPVSETAGGSIAVNSTGELAFVSVRESDSSPKIAIYELDSQQGAQWPPSELELNWTWAEYAARRTTLAFSSTARGLYEVYSVGDYPGGHDLMRMFSVPWSTSPPPPASQLCYDTFVLDLPLHYPDEADCHSVAFTKNLGNVPGGRAVFVDIVGSNSTGPRFLTLETGEPLSGGWEAASHAECRTTPGDGIDCASPPDDYECRPKKPHTSGEAGTGISYQKGPRDVATAHNGRFAYSIYNYVSGQQDDSFWRHEFTSDNDPGTADPVPADVPNACAGSVDPRCQAGPYYDLAITLPTVPDAPDGETGEEVWIVKNSGNYGAIDVFDSHDPALPTYDGTIRIYPPPTAITIAPIPLSGEASIYPAPLSLPFPGSWPPGVVADYDFLQLTWTGGDYAAQTLLPLMNLTDGSVTYALQFPNLPDGWTVEQPDGPTYVVDPLAANLDNIAFAPITIRSPSQLLKPLCLIARAWTSAGGLSPADFGLTCLRIGADCNNNDLVDDDELTSCSGNPWCRDCNYNGVLDECDIAAGDSADVNFNGVPDECEAGDLDHDGDVDIEDFLAFVACMAGPDVPVPPPGCAGGTFESADMGVDGDVDVSDFGSFAEYFTGADQ
jgi:hypothetical protein